MTKLGLHVNRPPSKFIQFVRDTQPRIIKFLDPNFDTAKACRDVSPKSMLIGRLVPPQPLDHPEQNAKDLAARIRPFADQLRGLYEAWEGYNEIGLVDDKPEDRVDHAKRFNAFQVVFSEAMRANGFKTIAYSFATGNPNLELWQYLQDGAAAADYLGLHEYDAPTMEREHTQGLATGTGGMMLCLRYRRVWDLLEPRARKPIILSECGIDGSSLNVGDVEVEDGKKVHRSGYKHFLPEHGVAAYMRQLAWYDDELNKDDYVVGATLFCFGAESPQWVPFDMADEEFQDEHPREAFRQLLMQRQAPPRPVSVTGQFVKIGKVGQPTFTPSKPTDGGTQPAKPKDTTTTTTKPADTTTTPKPKDTTTTQPITKPQPCAKSAASWLAARFDANLQSALGCPTDDARDTFVAVQPFQHGTMIFRGDSRQIYALMQDGSYRAFNDTWNSDQPEGGFVTPPPNLLEPKRGFGKVWREQLGGAGAAIGFATADEQGMTGQVQNFERGLALHDERGNVRVLLNGGKWQ